VIITHRNAFEVEWRFHHTFPSASALEKASWNSSSCDFVDEGRPVKRTMLEKEIRRGPTSKVEEDELQE
jgi:hypothetical protein